MSCSSPPAPLQQALLSKDERKTLSVLKQQLEQTLHEAKGKLAAAQASLTAHRENPATDLSLELNSLLSWIIKSG